MQNSISTLFITTLLISCSTSVDNKSQHGTEDEKIEKLTLTLEQVSLDPFFYFENLKKQEKLTFHSTNKENTLFLYISDFQCTNLIEQELKVLKNGFDLQNIILLCNYKSKRHLKIQLLRNETEIEAYIVNENFPSTILNLTNPTYFKVDKNMKLKNVYIPKLGDHEGSRQYLTHELIEKLNTN